MSRDVFLLGVALTLLVLGAAVTDRLPGPPPNVSARPGRKITEANFRRIRTGMPRRQVERILGSPPGDYTTNRSFFALDIWGNGVLMNPGTREEWWGDGGIIQVGFDSSSRAQRARFVKIGPIPPEPGPLSRLRSWLGW